MDRGVGPQSDLYAVGVMLYEVMTGTVPFDAESFSALVVKIVTEVPLHPCQRVPDLPPTVGDFIMKSMARTAQSRFNTAKEMAEALRAVAQGQAIQIEPVYAAEASFEAVQVSGTSGVSNIFPKTQIQHGGSGVSGVSGVSGTSDVSQTPMAFERTGEGKPHTWLFVGGGAILAVLLIAGVGGFLVLPSLLEEDPPPPPPPVATTSGQQNTKTVGDTTDQATTAPVKTDTGAASEASDAGATPTKQGPTKITVTYAIAPADATVFLDNRELQQGAAGTFEVPADGAAHAIKASAHGHEDHTQEFNATEDTRIAFSLTPVHRTKTSHTTAPTKAPPTTPTNPTRPTKRPGTGVVTGVVTPEGWGD